MFRAAPTAWPMFQLFKNVKIFTYKLIMFKDNIQAMIFEKWRSTASQQRHGQTVLRAVEDFL